MAALTVVFDLDGTLVDTAPDLIDTLNVVFARDGLPPVDYAAGAQHDRRRRPPHDRKRAQVRRPRCSAAARSIGCSPISSRTTPPTSPTARSRFRGSTPRSTASPSAVAAFAVCTNKLEGLSRLLLEALGLTPRFAAICGQDTFGMQKPDPEILRRTIAGGRRRAATGGDGGGFRHRHRDRPRRRRSGRRGRFRLQRSARQRTSAPTGSSAILTNWRTPFSRWRGRNEPVTGPNVPQKATG